LYTAWAKVRKYRFYMETNISWWFGHKTTRSFCLNICYNLIVIQEETTCRKIHKMVVIKRAWSSHKPKNWTTQPHISQSLLELSFLQQNLLKYQDITIKLSGNNTRPKRIESEIASEKLQEWHQRVLGNKLQKKSLAFFFQTKTNPNPHCPDFHLWQAWSCHQFEELLLLLQSQTVK